MVSITSLSRSIFAFHYASGFLGALRDNCALDTCGNAAVQTEHAEAIIKKKVTEVFICVADDVQQIKKKRILQGDTVVVVLMS